MQDMSLFGKNAKLKEALLTEFRQQDRKGIYAWTQKKLAFNSNKMEGSTLTEDQTADLFDTGTIYGDDVYRAKDIEEANGHFLMFNHMLKTIDYPLTSVLIKEFHYNLKSGVFEDKLNGYAIGEYKIRPNIAGTETTTLPDDVPKMMEELLNEYHNSKCSIEEIARFHEKFEKIHPFQDGNGRVGRLLIFRELLVNDITPLIIADNDRMKYLDAIRSAHRGSLDLLVELFKQSQEDYRSILEYFNLLG